MYDGRIFKVELHNVEISGGKSKREVVRHPGAVVILPIDSQNKVYLVKQFRKPIEKEILELPAGKLEENELPETCAKRELKEELNLEAKQFRSLTTVYSSPGFTDEKMYIFVGEDLKYSYAQGEDDEFIEVEKIDFDDLWEKIKKGEIEDGKTTLAVSMYKSIKRDL